MMELRIYAVTSKAISELSIEQAGSYDEASRVLALGNYVLYAQLPVKLYLRCAGIGRAAAYAS